MKHRKNADPLRETAIRYVAANVIENLTLLVLEAMRLQDDSSLITPYTIHNGILYHDKHGIGYTVEQRQRKLDSLKERISELEDEIVDLDWVDEDELRQQVEATNEELRFLSAAKPVTRTIYEWWLVTAEMGEDLMQFNEPMLRIGSAYIWGRTACGQAIHMDAVMQELCLLRI